MTRELTPGVFIMVEPYATVGELKIAVQNGILTLLWNSLW